MEFEKLKKIIAEVLNVDPDEITMETTFQDDLGADSLDVYQIIMGIEEEFDIEIPAETAEQVTTVEDAVAVSYTHLAVKCFGQSVLLQTKDENRKDRRN